MSARDRAAAAISRMEQVRREMAERRELRHRNGMAIRRKAVDNITKHGPEMVRAVEDMRAVARRRQVAGGWATEAVDRGNDRVMSLGPHHDEPTTERPTAERVTQAPPERGRTPADPRPRPRPQVLDDEEDFSNQSTWMTNR